MKRYKVETQKEGSVRYFFIRDMESLEIVLLPSKYLMHSPLPIIGNICWKTKRKQKISMRWITRHNMIISQNI